MLKWVSKSSALTQDRDKGRRMTPEDSDYSSNSDSALLRFASAGSSLDNISDKLEDVHITSDKEAGDIKDEVTSPLSSWRSKDDESSSPRSIDSGVGGSKVSLNKAIKARKSNSKNKKFVPEDHFKRRESYSMLWEAEMNKNDRGYRSLLSMNTLYQYLSISSFMITLPCVLHFPIKTLEHGGSAFILVYSSLLLVLIFPASLLQLLFSGMSRTNPVSIWAKLVPVSAGLGPGLLLTSILCCSVTLVDTAKSLLYLWSSFVNIVPTSNTIIKEQHHQHLMISQLFVRMNQSYLHKSINVSEDTPMYSEHKNALLLMEILTAGAFLLIMTLFLKRSALRNIQCFLQIIVISLLVAILVRSASSSNASMFFKVLKPDWSKLLEASTWVSAAMLALVSTNLHTGVIMTLDREKSSDFKGVTLMFATVTHLVFCVLITFVIISFISSQLEHMSSRFSVIMMIQETKSEGGPWCQIIIILIFLLSVASILSKLMVPLAFIEDKPGTAYGSYLKKFSLLLTMIMISVLPYFLKTKDFIKIVEMWGVEISSTIVTALTLVTIVWCYGVTRMLQKYTSREGGSSASSTITMLHLVGNSGLVFFPYCAVMAILCRAQKDDAIGPIIASLLITFVTLSSIIRVYMSNKRERKRLSWREYLMEILGKRSRYERRVTNSYRTFERCDMTMSNMLTQVHLQHTMSDMSESGTNCRKSSSNRNPTLSSKICDY